MTEQEQLQQLEAARPDFDNQPKEPEFLKSRKWFGADVDGDFLSFTDPYKPPRYTLERKMVPFANIGELHVISGKAGHGKTNLMSMLMATILSGQQGNTRYRDGIPKPVILYVDTEMGKDDTIAVKNRVCTLAGIPYDRQNDQFFILRLRDTELAEDRWRKTLKALWLVKEHMGEGQCLHLFLDGMLDIVEDYNDQKECQPIIRKCMMLATYFDASLWAVLHENPMVDKLVGTLGSIAQRKVSEIFVVIKVKQSELKDNDRRDDLPDIYFKVKQVKARGKDVADWLFRYETNAGGWGQPVEIEDNGARVVNSKEIQMMKECNERFKSFNWTSSGATYTDLDKHLNNQGITSNRKKGDLINAAKEFGILTTTGTKGHFKYHYNGLKDIPNDEPNALPFDKQDGEDVVPF